MPKNGFDIDVAQTFDLQLRPNYLTFETQLHDYLELYMESMVWNAKDNESVKESFIFNLRDR